jgi:small subunit ribosomal protein S2
MGGLPDALFVIDVKREAIAISEASKMGIPIVGIVDSNSSPEGIDYMVPGNDDAIRSISLFTRAVSDACLEGSKLATGLKPSADSSGPKIIKKEDKQESSNEKDLEQAKVKEPKEPKEPKEDEKEKEAKVAEESKEKEESVETEEQTEDPKVDSKSEEVEEGKET